MAKDLVLVLDLGSSTGKASLFSASGELLAQAAVPYPMHVPVPGAAEQHPDDWWAVFRSLVPPLVARCGPPAAISVTGQMHGVIALDRNATALGPFYTLRDRRCLSEIPAMERAVTPQEIYQITGARLSAAAPAAKLLWMRRTLSEHFQRAQVFLSAKDFLRWRLTGEIATEPLDAAGMVLYDLEHGTWSEALLECWGLPQAKLPPIKDPTALAGTLQPQPARELGLVAGTPVVVGAGDDVEFLGAGLTEPGQGLEHLGTTGSLLVCIDRPLRDPERRLELGPHVEPGRWLIGGSTSAAGAALRWVADLLGLPELPPPDPRPVPGHQPLLVPHLVGERCPLWDPIVQGTLVGLELGQGQEALARAAFEGVTFSLRHILEALQQLGAAPTRLVLTDGRSVTWAALRANIYGMPLQIPRQPEATALGAMILAGVGVGLFSSVAAAVRQVVSIERAVAPEAAATALYQRRYRLYRAASTAAQAMEAACD
ncbi:MAG: hypothetical protein HY335_08740 [Deinococcus sp.]|nr:hypothetical protein [Deinococcus sp.]